jgi:protein TonB
MAVHPEILDEREPIKKYVWASAALHALCFATLIATGARQGGRAESWGDPTSIAGGSVGITPVSRLPIPSRGGRENPVANDTESLVPAPPKPAVRRVREPDPDAVALKGRAKTAPRETAASRKRYTPPGADRPDQLYSSSGAAAASPLYGGAGSPGAGVAVGTGSPFGARFGFYEQLLRQRVAEKWRTAEIDQRLQSAPPVIVTFEILRSGAIRNVRIVQSSGNLPLDYSAQRAIMEASPFPELPRAFERDSANIEFWFQLKR